MSGLESSVNLLTVKRVNKFKKMSEVDFFKERSFHSLRKISGANNLEQKASKQLLGVNFNEKFPTEGARQESRTVGNWCEVVSSSLSNVSAKQAWKNGTEKLSQTFNNVRTTFGALSQRIKKSTKKRRPLVNAESPVTSFTETKVALGRTPTKLYSPFTIVTPTGKENIPKRCSLDSIVQLTERLYSLKKKHKLIEDETHSTHLNLKGIKKKPKRTRLDLDVGESSSDVKETVLSSDLLQTQIGIYEFQSVAKRILQNCSNK